MPSHMILNTGSVVGYNNQLKQAGPGMKLGVNNDQSGHKKSALHLMGGGPSKINVPNSHPSNPIHKAAVSQRGEGQSPSAKQSKSFPAAVSRRGGGQNPMVQSQPKKTAEPSSPSEPLPTSSDKGWGRALGSSGNASHDVNKTLVAVGAVAIVGLVFLMRR